MDKLEILNSQLKRLRSMNSNYHKQFLLDVRLMILLLFVAFALVHIYSLRILFYIPYLSLFFAILLSYHAHYLILSRHLSEYYEKKINILVGEELLVTHEVENNYLFNNNVKKIVVAGMNKDFTWFSFVTLFITFIGSLAYIYSIYLMQTNNLLTNSYILLIALITLFSLSLGIWWFINGEGESKIYEILKESN